MQSSHLGSPLDDDRERLREAICRAARDFRDAMRRYIEEQAHLAEKGASLAELVESNQEGFEETAQAEDALFAALDALDRHKWALPTEP